MPIEKISDEEKIVLSDISFFNYNKKALERRRQTITNVINALRQRIAGNYIEKKVVSNRYTCGLNSLSSTNLVKLKNDLEYYINQLS